jgi:phosphonopyruvate decarboxylase
MIDITQFLDYLSEQGFSLASGVPCSYFKDTLNSLDSFVKIQYIPATREDESVGIATGYFFGGKQCFLIMQNSGLATIGDALTSLTQLYKIPMLIFVSYRGLEPDATFPEHRIMGDITENVLKAYEVPYWILDEDNWENILNDALGVMNETSLPVCILVEKGVLSQ